MIASLVAGLLMILFFWMIIWWLDFLGTMAWLELGLRWLNLVGTFGVKIWLELRIRISTHLISFSPHYLFTSSCEMKSMIVLQKVTKSSFCIGSLEV